MRIHLHTFIICLFLIFTSAQINGQTYCEPTSNCTFGTILSFETSGADQNISNLISGCNSGTGFYYFNNKTLKSSHTDSILFTITPAMTNWYIGYAVWMDWNSDGDFNDTGEDVWNSGTYVQGAVSDTIFIPSSIGVGQIRMRVRSSYFSVPGNPCGNVSWGETEDYPVLITLAAGTDMSLEKLLSPSVFSIGNNTLKIRTRNNGASTISIFDLGYQLNNNTPVTINNINQTINSGSAFDYQFANPLSVSAGSHSLKLWVNNVNNLSLDSIPSNDTLFLSFCTGMSGTYTIGSSGDFSNINSAIQAIQNCGIAGSILFNIAAGTYNEQITIPEFTGLSSNTTITFDGIDQTKVSILKSVSGANTALIVFDEADYITFKNIKIQNSAAAGNAILLKASANFNTIENCAIIAGNRGLSSNSANSTLVKNNSITGGNSGIYFTGPTSRCNYNKFIGNSFSGQKNSAIHLTYQRFCLLQYNSIKNQANTATHGIYCYYNSGTQIDGNIIEPYRSGLYISRENYVTSDSGLVVNNIIGNFGSSTEQKGLHLDFSWNIHVLHNTVVMNSAGNTDSSQSAIFMYYPIGAKIKNNIFYNSGKNILLAIQGTYFPSYVACDLDYNLYYTTLSGSQFYNNGTFYSDFSSFKNSSNFLIFPHDDNSFYQQNPNFVSSSNFHLSANHTPYNGTNLGVLYDVDGDNRCIYAHTIGADESTYNSGKPTAGFTVEDTVCLNSPVSFINHASPAAPLGHEWYLRGIYQTNTLNFTYTFNQYATRDTVMLITKSCGGADTFSKSIYIDSPHVKPNSAFLASKNIVNPFDEVQFYSMGGNCPTDWEWEITPVYTYDPYLGQVPNYYYMNFTSRYSQNPKVKFEYPGKYSVCLITSNAIGSDTLCQQDYIYVIPVQYMCLYALPEIQNSISGILYDDGGPASDYSNGTGSICDFLLTPCTDTLFFTFSEFQVSAGDYLRVYDGSDNQGTPLWDVSSYGANGLTGNMSNSAFDTTLISYSGNMYFEWSANAAGTNRGFIGEWMGSPSIEPPPSAKFSCPDTVCLDVPVTFQNLSSGADLRYAWNFDGTGFTQSIAKNPTYTFTTSGINIVTLNVMNCGGDSTFVKNVFVLGGSAAPTADFTADNVKPFRTIDVVSFTDLSHANALNPLGCVDYWQWSISPGTYTIVSGFPNAQNPKITFNDTGCYAVTLVAGYGSGRDTLTKTCYIKPNDYCIPIVNNLNNDLGISKVELASISNTSSSGIVKYSDFAGSYYTYLDEFMQYTIKISRNSSNNAMTRKVWIDWNIDGDFEDSGELVVQEGNSTTLVFSDTFSVPKVNNYGSTRMRVGVCIAGYPNTACGPNFYGEFEDYRLILRPYSIPPEISLTGPDTLVIMQCHGFNDPGATASSFLFGNMTNQIVVTHNIDPNYPGVYQINYTVTDPKGNKATKPRTVIVVAESNAPVISLKGNAVDTVNVFDTYHDPGVSASDSCSGIDRIEINSNLNTQFTGHYSIDYKAYDKNLNKASVSRTVHVLDTEAPDLQLMGRAIDTVEVNTSYTDSGATYTDNYDKNPVLTVTGSVNISKIGVYNILYEVTDSSGNYASLTRTVYVLDRTAPQITSNFNNGDSIFIEVFTSVFDKITISFSDNYDAAIDLTMVEAGSYYTEFSHGQATLIGCFDLSYTVTDASNNSSFIQFIVCVNDNEKPLITMLGNPIINIKRWHTADTSEMLINVTDNYDQNPLIWVSGSYYDDYLKHEQEGFYNVVYHAKDQSGNEADSVIRYINVLPNNSIFEDLNDHFVTLYPNPAKNIIYVLLDIPDSEFAELCVMNSLGQCIITQKVMNIKQQIHTFSLAEVADGMYMLRITTEKGVLVKKFILAK